MRKTEAAEYLCETQSVGQFHSGLEPTRQ